MFVSSHLGYVDFVEYFIVKCPDHINVKDKEGRSSFYVACENGHIDMVRYLMKFHHDINSENAEKTTALSAACLNCHIEVAKLLLDNDANINKTNNSNQSTLYFACLNGNVKLVQRLLYDEYNVDITIRDTVGSSALDVACKAGHTDIVKTLIAFGMDVNQKQNNYNTPLFLACKYGVYDTVKYIIDFIDSKQNRKTRAEEIVNLHTTQSGWTVLHTACSNGYTKIVKLLTDDVGMPINYKTNRGYTPLHLACRDGHFDIVKHFLHWHDHSIYSRVDISMLMTGQILNSCVDTSIKNTDGWLLLHSVCYKGHL